MSGRRRASSADDLTGSDARSRARGLRKDKCGIHRCQSRGKLRVRKFSSIASSPPLFPESRTDGQPRQWTSATEPRRSLPPPSCGTRVSVRLGRIRGWPRPRSNTGQPPASYVPGCGVNAAGIDQKASSCTSIASIRGVHVPGATPRRNLRSASGGLAPLGVGMELAEGLGLDGSGDRRAAVTGNFEGPGLMRSGLTMLSTIARTPCGQEPPARLLVTPWRSAGLTPVTLTASSTCRRVEGNVEAGDLEGICAPRGLRNGGCGPRHPSCGGPLEDTDEDAERRWNRGKPESSRSTMSWQSVLRPEACTLFRCRLGARRHVDLANDRTGPDSRRVSFAPSSPQVHGPSNPYPDLLVRPEVTPM